MSISGVELHEVLGSLADRGELLRVSFATAGELLDEGMCTGQCLLGRCATDQCSCRCGGRFHGVALGALVEMVTPVATKPPLWRPGPPAPPERRTRHIAAIREQLRRRR